MLSGTAPAAAGASRRPALHPRPCAPSDTTLHACMWPPPGLYLVSHSPAGSRHACPQQRPPVSKLLTTSCTTEPGFRK